MDVLFLLIKKFTNKRIARNIYEFVDHDRAKWLEKYRAVIKTGYNVHIEQDSEGQPLLRYPEWARPPIYFEYRGVHTFCLAEQYRTRGLKKKITRRNWKQLVMSSAPSWEQSSYTAWLRILRGLENNNYQYIRAAYILR